ncbi:hypothetical protein [Pararhizobium sp. A13]|uniref:hypothetical protein n=1 Tax=Pararhizobium sp. A13 TaxID=3133975 RepID=UPI00311AC6FA
MKTKKLQPLGSGYALYPSIGDETQAMVLALAITLIALVIAVILRNIYLSDDR